MQGREASECGLGRKQDERVMKWTVATSLNHPGNGRRCLNMWHAQAELEADQVRRLFPGSHQLYPLLFYLRPMATLRYIRTGVKAAKDFLTGGCVHENHAQIVDRTLLATRTQC